MVPIGGYPTGGCLLADYTRGGYPLVQLSKTQHEGTFLPTVRDKVRTFDHVPDLIRSLGTGHPKPCLACR